MTARTLRGIIAGCRLRDRLFEGADLADPSWDILLDLAAAAAEGRRVSITSAAIASCAPATTGLRHIALLEAAGLVSRQRDEQDQRRTFLTLTPRAEACFAAWLEGATPEKGLRAEIERLCRLIAVARDVLSEQPVRRFTE